MEDKLSSVDIHMKSGRTIKAYFADAEYDEIYSNFIEQSQFLNFATCTIVTSQIEAIEWKE